jgi:hypothetical protein
MPNTKPTLRSLDFGPPDQDGTRAISATMSGPYAGTKTVIGELLLGTWTTSDGETLYRWHLTSNLLTAEFLCPTNDPTDNRPVATARWMLRAAYRAAGYGLFSPPGAE